ncbi:fimbrial protein [Burkholderia multivorans]|uniref:fimbrial protein n=1 Tax=Burkholderia multivorans TaxID=87883 RepID=UPI002B25064C|nr:fimbrial protein [Burkholderia multivorans]MEB2487542.1 fimbrial protein [Burkholderia multivorans]MEB2569616.1 fimbrial protein [Burkholderia multivorans]
MIRSVQRRHIVRWLSAILIALAWVAPAHAQSCSYSPASARAFRFGFPQWIGVPAGAQNGTVLASTTMSIGYSCPPTMSPSGWSFTYRSFFYSSASVPGDLYYTTNMGIGIRVTNLNTGQQMKNDRNHGFTQWMPPRTGTAPMSGTLDFKLELVKINDMIYSSGPLLAAGLSLQFGEFRITNNATLVANPVNIMWNNGPITITAIPQSCRATFPDTPVQLDSVQTSRLPTPGSTAGDKPFHVGLSCSSGTNVYVTLTDLSNPGNTSDQLTLAPGSTASGVRLRLLRPGGVPVSFGPDSSSAGNLNQWYLGPSGSTTGISLTAQYISTGQVKAGSVKGLASFTLSYQ